MLFIAVTCISYLAFTSSAASLPGIFLINDKLNHMAAFAAIALLFECAYPQLSLTTQIVILIAYGAVVEIVQYFLPGREFSVIDLAADGAGIAVYRIVRRAVAKL